MSSSLYILVFITAGLLGAAIIFIILYTKKNGHTELYSEGLHNENDGHYDLALHNYQSALSEIKKLKLDKKFYDKIAQKIKTLQATIDYEKNFRLAADQDDKQASAGPTNKQALEAVH